MRLYSYQVSNSFQWVQCDAKLLCLYQGNETLLSLAPSVALLSLQGLQIPIKIHIEFQKEFVFDDQVGWNWHKSWKIPKLKISLSSNQKILESTKACEIIQAEIFAVKIESKCESEPVLIEVGLEGTRKLSLQKGECVFDNLKFKQTSYNNLKSKFHLVLIITIANQLFNSEQILCSMLSSPIYVDSRKNARDSKLLRVRQLNAISQCFQIQIIKKEFVKRKLKQGLQFQQKIDNTGLGLIKYLSAANIRFKVKHPLFMAIIFHNVIKLMLHPSVDRSSFSLFFQESLKSVFKKSKTNRVPDSQKPFHIYLMRNQYIKECRQELSIYQCPIIAVVTKPHAEFVQLSVEEIKENYRQHYSQIEKIEMNFQNEEEDLESKIPKSKSSFEFVYMPKRKSFGLGDLVPIRKAIALGQKFKNPSKLQMCRLCSLEN